MSNDPDSGDGVPDPVRAWLAGLAEDRDLSEGELFERLLSGNGGRLLDDSGVDVDELARRVEELETAVETLDGNVDELIRDIRERVIQVKQETDAKAPHDHDHPGLSEDLDRLDEHLEALAHDLVELDSSTEDRLDAVDDRVRRGFANFEEVLEYLIETTDDAHEKLEAVAAATVDLRRRTGRLAKAEARRSAADRLRATAHEHGVAEAKCESCGATIDLRLLTTPDCLHCDARFVELVPRRGFFRSSLLHTGERPALEGEVAGESNDLALIVADEGSSPPTFERREPDRQGTPVSDDPTATGEEDRPAEDDGTDTASPSPGGSADLDVDAVTGVGPTYAERLRAAGVDTVGELALSDPSRLADETDIEPGRVANLVRRARALADAE